MCCNMVDLMIIFSVQRRCKLDSLNKEDDLELGTKKLIDQAAKLNEKRFQMAIKIKVRLYPDAYLCT